MGYRERRNMRIPKFYQMWAKIFGACWLIVYALLYLIAFILWMPVSDPFYGFWLTVRALMVFSWLLTCVAKWGRWF